MRKKPKSATPDKLIYGRDDFDIRYAGSDLYRSLKIGNHEICVERTLGAKEVLIALYEDSNLIGEKTKVDRWSTLDVGQAIDEKLKAINSQFSFLNE